MQGWEETVDAAVSYLLRTCLSKSSKEQALTLSSQLSMPKDTSRLKKNITLFCDRLAKGGRLSLSTDSAAQQAAVMPGKTWSAYSESKMFICVLKLKILHILFSWQLVCFSLIVETKHWLCGWQVEWLR